MGNIEVIERQFDYMRRRGLKGELHLGPFDLTRDEVKQLTEKDYRVTKVFSTGYFKKIDYYEVYQDEEEIKI